MLIWGKNMLKEIQILSDEYLRHGGKKWRRQQVKRLKKICSDIAVTENIGHPAQIGKAHVHRYYRRIENLTERTRYHHYLALCELWKMLGRHSYPPKPIDDRNKKFQGESNVLKS